jgi:hypothetical protein
MSIATEEALPGYRPLQRKGSGRTIAGLVGLAALGVVLILATNAVRKRPPSP